MPPDELDWPEDWQPAGDRAAALRNELRREMSWRHPLRRQRLRAVAHRPGTDDVLFEIIADPPRVAEVHLTWRREWWSAQWPWTVMYDDLESWKASQASAGGD